MKKDIQKIIKVPDNCSVRIMDKEIFIKNGQEEIAIKFKIAGFKPKMQNGSLILEKKFGNKNDKKLINSLANHILNAINGFEKKYEYQLQICSAHFPMNVKIEKNKLIIKNFFGERKDRILEITPNTLIKINNDIISVISANKELAGQQSAQIENITKITSRDRRVFQDGIWIIKKEKGKRQNEKK